MSSNIFIETGGWPYAATLLRLALALGLGLLVGLERERRGKDAGSRTFAFAAAAGCAGGLLGDPYAITALVLLVPFIIFINIHSLEKDEHPEITTSAALLVIGFVGVMCGKGHTMTAVGLGLVTTGLLAWKQPLSGFSVGITEGELRAAILLGILAFVIYPVLPSHPIDRWGLVQPRVVLTTVILVAAIGFCNYLLHKIYGNRGFEAAGFFGGLVNSIVAIMELSTLASEDALLVDVAFRGTMLATAAMLVRNAAILAFIAPQTLYYASVPMLLMLLICGLFTITRRTTSAETGASPDVKVQSPFSLPQALKFGVLFLVVSVLGSLSQRALGNAGFFVVNSIGAVVSSASSVAAAGELAAQTKLSIETGGIGSVLACVASTLISIPLIARYGKNKQLTRSAMVAIGLVSVVGIVASIFAPAMGTGLKELLATTW